MSNHTCPCDTMTITRINEPGKFKKQLLYAVNSQSLLTSSSFHLLVDLSSICFWQPWTVASVQHKAVEK